MFHLSAADPTANIAAVPQGRKNIGGTELMKLALQGSSPNSCPGTLDWPFLIHAWFSLTEMGIIGHNGIVKNATV